MAATPTSNIGFQNFFMAHLSADISASSTDIPLDVVPTPTEGFLVIDPDSTANHEIIYYNSKTASKVVCPSAVDGRGQDGTTAVPHGSGTTVIMAPVGAHFSMFKSLLLASSPDWTSLPVTPVVTSNNGQRENLLTYVGADYTDRLQAGTKLRIPRTSTVPTKSAQFVAASSQYATRASASVAGITFTNNFTCEAWVYLDSYTGGAQAIISRIGASQGWQFEVTTLGQVRLDGYNGAYANVRAVQSYQSIPLNKWVHIAATLDMSGFTAATCKTFIDGIDVPASLVQGGTNPTSLVQEGNLQISSYNGAANAPINGKVANARVWSTARTVQQIRDNMGITLSTATGLVANFPLNGDFSDTTANGNTLTSSGGAIATYASNPFSAVEYAVVTKVAKVATDTQVTVFTGPCSIPNETLGTTNYSSARSPYGFPSQANKWAVVVPFFVNLATTGATNAWHNRPETIVVFPTGEWKGSWQGAISVSRASNYSLDCMYGLAQYSNTNAVASSFTALQVPPETVVEQTHSSNVASIFQRTQGYAAFPISLTSASTFQMVNGNDNSGATCDLTIGTNSKQAFLIKAECAYL